MKGSGERNNQADYEDELDRIEEVVGKREEDRRRRRSKREKDSTVRVGGLLWLELSLPVGREAGRLKRGEVLILPLQNTADVALGDGVPLGNGGLT